MLHTIFRLQVEFDTVCLHNLVLGESAFPRNGSVISAVVELGWCLSIIYGPVDLSDSEHPSQPHNTCKSDLTLGKECSYRDDATL